MSARDFQSPELGSSTTSVTSSIPRTGNESSGANGDKKAECPLQQAHRHAARSTSQAARSAAARRSSQVLGTSGTNETQCPSRQAQDFIYRERVRPRIQDGNETSHQWILGAVAELLDNAVDEVPHGATKVLVDSVVNPHDGSPSLLVQDDGGGMNPISLWKCMTAECPNRKPPDSIGQNGTGFKAAISCLGAGAIVFTRYVHTSTPTQSIGLRFLPGEETDQTHILIPMVNYNYDPVTAEITKCERKPGQFRSNMSMLLRLSPYHSEEELLQNFNDIGPHGTKIIVFNLSRNTKGDLDLDFNTDTKDIRISAATMNAENRAVGDQSHLVYRYRTSLRAYASILYMGLPKHFRVILRGEEVKRRNLVTELKHSQYIRYRRSGTEREDEVVLGFLDDAPDIDTDRFCFYYKQRLILPFVPAYGFSDRNRSIVGVLQPNHLKPARNKQDFQWSSELEALQKILKEMGTEFWKQLKRKELTDAASQLSLAPPGSHNEENLTASNTTGMLSQSQMTPSAPAHLAVPILESSYDSMPLNMVPRAPDPCLLLFPITPTGDGHKKRVMDMADAWDQGNNSNGVPACHPTTLSLGWNNGGTSSHGIQRAITPHLPTSAMSSMAGGGRHPAMAAVASTNNYGMNISGISAPTTSLLAYLASWFSQPNNSGMGPNGFMRAQTPHTFHMPATPGLRRRSTPASSVTAPPLPVMQTATVNNILSPPPHSVPAGAMVALHDLQIKRGHNGTDDDTAIPLAVGMAAAAAGATATYATSIPAPAMMNTGDGRASAFNPWRPRGFDPDDGPSSSSRQTEQAQELQGSSNQYRASAFYPWCPPRFKPVAGSSSSRQAQELQGGSNQGEQGAKPLLDLFKP